MRSAMICAVSLIHTIRRAQNLALQSLSGNSSPPHNLIQWEKLYCTLLRVGTFFLLSLAAWCPSWFLTNSTISCVIRTWHEVLNYKILKLYSQHPWHFYWCHEVGCLYTPPLRLLWQNSIVALKRALLSNHCCPAESHLCPQSHLYVLILNYPA